MTHRWRMLGALAWRESRTARRRLLVYMSSISLGVAALVAVDSFAANVEASIHQQSRELLGGDLAISAPRPFTDQTATVLDSLQGAGTTVARSASFVSMGLVPRTTGTRLVQVRAVSDSFPLFGVVETEPAGVWAQLQGGARTIVDPALLPSLNAHIGDSLQLGFARFEIIGTLVRVPGDPGVTAAIGPRVMIPASSLEQTQLLGFGSRATYEAFFRMPAGGDQRTTRDELRDRLNTDTAATRIRVRTAADTEQNLADAIQRLSDYLGIVGLIALLLGGIGVASGVHAFVVAKIDTAAVFRCLGATGPQVLAVYIAQAAAMGLVGAAAGAVLGIGVQFLMPLAVADFLPITVEATLAWRAIGMGFLAGAEVAIVFALLPLLALRHVSPLQALRRETDESGAMRRVDLPQLVVLALAAASVVAIAVARSERTSDGVFIAGGVLVVLSVLWVAATLVTWVARRAVRGGWPYVVRQGIANLYRPSNQTRPVVLALGFGVFLVTTLALLEANLLRRFNIGVEASRGNLLFYDVQQDQTRGVDSLVAAGQIEVVQRTPIVTMRIAAINGQTVDELSPPRRGGPDALPDTVAPGDAGARGGAAGARDGGPSGRGGGSRGGPGGGLSGPIRREYRSTYRAALLSTEPIVEGRPLHSPTEPGQLNEVSFEHDVAQELGLSLGDTVMWNVSGVTVPTVVTSLRDVNWARFEPNFFAILTPPALEHAPQMFVYILRAPDPMTLASLQRSVVERYPNVSSVDLTLVQETVAGIMNRASLAIRFLAFFGVIMGIPVLLSAVAATRRARVRDGVLLRILGATRAQIRKILLSEYAVLGLLGTLAGVLLATGAAWALMHFIFDDTFVLAPMQMLGLGLGMSALTAVIGVVTGRDVFAAPPAVAMRES